MQQKLNPHAGVGFVYPKIIHTPLQSADCGANAPKTRSSAGFAMWSCLILADHNYTNSLIQKEVV